MRVPRKLEEIVLKCLEKEPERRPPSAQALRQALAASLADADGVEDTVALPPIVTGTIETRPPGGATTILPEATLKTKVESEGPKRKKAPKAKPAKEPEKEENPGG